MTKLIQCKCVNVRSNDFTIVSNVREKYRDCDFLKEQGEPRHDEICLMSYATNKSTDQPAHPRDLINTFVVRCLDSIIPLLADSAISRLVSVAEQAGFSLTWSQTPIDRFSRDVAQADCRYRVSQKMRTFLENVDVFLILREHQ